MLLRQLNNRKSISTSSLVLKISWSIRYQMESQPVSTSKVTNYISSRLFIAMQFFLTFRPCTLCSNWIVETRFGKSRATVTSLPTRSQIREMAWREFTKYENTSGRGIFKLNKKTSTTEWTTPSLVPQIVSCNGSTWYFNYTASSWFYFLHGFQSNLTFYRQNILSFNRSFLSYCKWFSMFAVGIDAYLLMIGP